MACRFRKWIRARSPVLPSNQSLAPLKESRRISVVWSDDEITAGTEFDPRIRSELEESQLIHILLSASYFKSYYYSQVERPLAVARHEAGLARVVTILVRPVRWENPQLAKIHDRAKESEDRDSMDQDQAWTEVALEIERVIDDLKQPDFSATPETTITTITFEPATFHCTPMYDAPRSLRDVGIAELLPDFVLRVLGDTGQRRVADIWLRSNTVITSRVDTGLISEATLSLATGRSISAGPTLGLSLRAKQVAANGLVFLHVPLHELGLLPFG